MWEKQNQAQTDLHQVSVLQKLHETTKQCHQLQRGHGSNAHTDYELYEFMI